MREKRIVVLIACLSLSFLFLPSDSAHAQAEFVRGDVNADGVISISDAMLIRRIVFLEGGPRPCLDAADYDDDGEITLEDHVAMINFSAIGFVEPPALPYPAVGQDPTADELSCEQYDVAPTEESDDFVRLGEVSGAPGDEVILPVFVTNSAIIEAFHLVVQIDPELFQLGSRRELPLVTTEGSPLSRPFPGFTSFFRSPTNTDSDSIFRLLYMPQIFLDQEFGMPPGEDVYAFGIRGVIPETAPPGASASFEFVTIPERPGLQLEFRTELSILGEAGRVRSLPRAEGGLFKIVADVTFFRRGDSNGDGDIDLSDGTRTLDYLFLGGLTLSCLDAADADDDGVLLLSDAIFTFNFLFSGNHPTLPLPYPDLGPDLTDDDLGCAVAHEL